MLDKLTIGGQAPRGCTDFKNDVAAAAKYGVPHDLLKTSKSNIRWAREESLQNCFKTKGNISKSIVNLIKNLTKTIGKPSKSFQNQWGLLPTTFQNQ